MKISSRLTSLLALGLLFAAPQSCWPAQPAILAAAGASKRIVVFPDPENAPATQTLVPGLPANANPQGAAYYRTDSGLIADAGNSRIFVVQVSTGALLATIEFPDFPPTGECTAGREWDCSSRTRCCILQVQSISPKSIHFHAHDFLAGPRRCDPHACRLERR